MSAAKAADGIESLLREGIEAGAFTCAAVALSRSGRRRVWFAGLADPERGEECGPNTRFDLASLTKPLATAATLLRLCEIGKVSLTDPVSDWLPECRHMHGATVFHLATHTSGLPDWRKLFLAGYPMEAAYATPLDRLPGLGYIYSDIGYILLGEILQRAAGKPLDELARTLVFEPLGMAATGFGGPGPFAVTAARPWGGGQTLRGEVHDPNARALRGVAGHAGLFAPLGDVARFFESLLPEGESFLSEGALEALLRNRIPQHGHQSVGFFTHGNDMLPDGGMLGVAAAGHTGFTGTAGLVNPDHGPAIVLLTNRIFCDADGTKYRPFRRRLVSVLAALR